MISYTLKVNGTNYACEIGAVIVLDGTETFDSGTIEIKNTTIANEFTEADDVIFTAGTKTFELIIQADKVERITNTIYDHTITLTEETAKLVKKYSVDRFFTLNGTSLFTHQEILNRVRTTTPFFNPLFTIATATQTALGITAPQKKFEGMNLFQIATDVMRGINAVPRLSNGVLSHTPYNEINNPITLSNLIGWQKDNDFNNYATTIISRAKNITYDLDITTGSTWWPSESERATPRSSSGDYSDDKAQYQLGLDIRRTNQVFIIGYELSGGTIIDMDISDYVFSKEEWDGLELGSRTSATLFTQIAQRNTLYYTVGSNVIENMGNEYTSILSAPRTPIEMLVKTWLVNNGYLITDYKDFSINELAIRVNYQPYLEGNISSEKWDTSVSKVSEILNNQKDTTLDIGRYGGVMNTIANRLANGNWLIKIVHSSPDDILELFDYTSDLFKIIKARYEFYPKQIIGTYELSQYWATINGYQSVYKNTDPYTIGRDNVNANFRHTEYLEFSTTNRTDTGSLTTQGRKTLMNNFDYLSADDLPVQLALVDSSEQTGYTIGMGTMSSGANGIRFIGKFQEPKNAGYELVSDTIGEASNAIPYADTTGYMQSVNIEYINDYIVVSGEDKFPRLDVPSATGLMTLPELTVYKNPNEVFGLTTELLPCTDESDIIKVYNGFSKFNNIVNDGSISGLNIYYSLSTTKYDEFDTIPKEVQSSEPINSATISKTDMSIDISAIPTTGVSWAIGTATELWLAVNYDGTFRSKIYINNLLTRSTTEAL